jgi:hypothetical protein
MGVQRRLKACAAGNSDGSGDAAAHCGCTPPDMAICTSGTEDCNCRAVWMVACKALA